MIEFLSIYGMDLKYEMLIEYLNKLLLSIHLFISL